MYTNVESARDKMHVRMCLVGPLFAVLRVRESVQGAHVVGDTLQSIEMS